MLLRRLMVHLQQQNWFAVVLDVLVVIVGIFLGMQVTDWNQKRIDREDERHYMMRLHEDIILVEKAAERVLDRRLKNFDDLILAMNVLVSKTPDTTLTKAECDAIGNSDILNLVVAALPSLTELQSSGRLGIIQSDEIRRSAVSLQQRIISFKEIINSFTDENHQLLMLYPELIQVSSVFNKEMNEFNLSTRCDLKGMQESKSFMNAVSTNLDIFDAYVRDGLKPWKTDLDRLHELTDQYLEVSHNDE